MEDWKERDKLFLLLFGQHDKLVKPAKSMMDAGHRASANLRIADADNGQNKTPTEWTKKLTKLNANTKKLLLENITQKSSINIYTCKQSEATHTHGL